MINSFYFADIIGEIYIPMKRQKLIKFDIWSGRRTNTLTLLKYLIRRGIWFLNCIFCSSTINGHSSEISLFIGIIKINVSNTTIYNIEKNSIA